MSVPALRDMPTVRAEWQPGVGYVIRLPGGIERIAANAPEARAIVARELPGTAIAFVYPAKEQPTR